MKNFKNISLVVLAAVALASCSKNDDESITIAQLPPSSQEFQSIRQIALQNQTQSFTATAGTGVITLTSAKGVTITLNGNNLTKNGNPVTGSFDIKFIELFDKGTMLVTNKPTMGVMPSGDKGILISGGEFYINAIQGGVQLATLSSIQLNVPNNLSGDPIDNTMVFWTGDTTDADNLAWKRDGGTPAGGQGGAVDFNQNSYNVTFGNFGWTNIDRFYSDPRPKTQILATVPAGYDNTNSSIYLSVDGEGQNQLAKFDTYNAITQQFSEHYGQIPIGLLCHIIFATEDNGQWRYGIKAVTTTANAVYAFSLAETTVGTEAQMIAAINAIQ
ncbi:hypothetical protein [Flavobacterium sp.]|uniref:hypothetical protein n=1 Tax=Flavobacterium sp. TaxID=239 RepID=UPI003750EE30